MEYFEYSLLVWIYVATRLIFLYFKLFVICCLCTSTGSDSHGSITHFINFFVYCTLDVWESAEGWFLWVCVDLCCTLSALNHADCRILPALCLSYRLTYFLSGNSYDSYQSLCTTCNPWLFVFLNRSSVKVHMCSEGKCLNTLHGTFFHSYLMQHQQLLCFNTDILAAYECSKMMCIGAEILICYLASCLRQSEVQHVLSTKTHTLTVVGYTSVFPLV